MRAAGRCLCHPRAALWCRDGGVLLVLQPTSTPGRSCRRQRRGARNGGKVEGTQKPKQWQGPRPLPPVLQEENKLISQHFQCDCCTQGGPAGLWACCAQGAGWGWCPWAVGVLLDPHHKPLRTSTSFYADGQVRASPVLHPLPPGWVKTQ